MVAKYFLEDWLSPKEEEFILSIPELLRNDILSAGTFVLSKDKVPRNILLDRLNTLLRFNGEEEIIREKYFAQKGKIMYQFEEIRIAIRPARKFSGWIRSNSRKGRGTLGSSRPESDSSEWSDSVKLNFISFLSVGEFSGTSPGIFFTLKSSRRAKRSPENE